MKWIMMGSAPVVVAGGLFLHGPLKTSETYARPAAEAAWVLETLQVPQAVTGMLSTVPNATTTREFIPGKSISWSFYARGGQVARFVAEMTPIDATHTRISSSFKMMGDAEKLMQTEYMPMAKQFSVVGRVALQEQLDSKMEKRAFDKEIVTKAMAGYAIANMGEIQQSVSASLDKAAEKFKEHDRDRAARAAGVSFVPGQPMVDPGRPAR